MTAPFQFSFDRGLLISKVRMACRPPSTILILGRVDSQEWSNNVTARKEMVQQCKNTYYDRSLIRSAVLIVGVIDLDGPNVACPLYMYHPTLSSRCQHSEQ